MYFKYRTEMRFRMRLSKDNFQYITDTVKLSFVEKEEKDISVKLNKMIDYIDVMNELDTENVEPLTHVIPLTNVFREDEVTSQNPSQYKDGYYVISKTNMFGG